MTFKKFLRCSLLLLLFSGLSALSALVGAYLYVSKTLPKVDTLADYRPPIITQVLADDGTVIAEYSKERRIVVPVSRMPEKLIQAFVAAEDSNFFKHKGIDLFSILRAAIKNIKAGGIVQGGSTITQQVAKSLLLTPEKKFSRKFKEAILAHRMEQRLTKEDILYLYLNQIYLGHSAYGVQAAAENYFDKNVEDLTLAECSIIAGLPQAPSRYSPYSHFQRAKERQKYVLGRMLEEGYISQLEANEAYAEEVQIHPRINKHISEAAYFTEQVRRYLEKTFGEEVLYKEGLKVYTTMNLRLQQAAQNAVCSNLHNHDKRQGYRGPLNVLPEEEIATYLSEKTERLTNLPETGTLVEGVLISGDTQKLTIRLGPYTGTIPIEKNHWAAPLRVVSNDTPPTGNARKDDETLLPVGSVILARLLSLNDDGSLLLDLEQHPEAQGALVAIEPNNGQVKVMVGGYDFAESQFNRMIQARRLPGSAIKPIIYAAALDKGYTPATVILDTPLIYKETSETGEETAWKPKNYSEKFYGPTSFRTALTKSHNVITIKILEDIGIDYAANYARKLGIDSPITRDLTLALGSSALTPLELATAYTVFANGGVRLSPTYITKVVDREGRILESIDPADFPEGPGAGQRLLRQNPQRIISPETAYLITNLMESVVRHGTGWRAKSLGRPVAGKTGTTNDLKDAWFAGYIPQLVTISWVGYDQERPLGDKETGSRAAAPAWVDFMKEAIQDYEPVNFPVPDTIEFHPTDPGTGLLATEDEPNMKIEAFAPGTAPTRYVLDEKTPQPKDFFRLDMDDL